MFSASLFWKFIIRSLTHPLKMKDGGGTIMLWECFSLALRGKIKLIERWLQKIWATVNPPIGQ